MGDTASRELIDAYRLRTRLSRERIGDLPVTVREVNSNDEPVSFWVNVMLRAGDGLGAVLFPVLMVIYKSIAST